MEKVRFGVVGFGNMGSAHCQTLTDGRVKRACLTAVCDIDPEKLKKSQEVYPDVPVFEKAEDMYASGLCDAVIIATPHYDHPPLAIKAFEAGLHVICEKPAGVYTAQVQELNEAAKKSGKVFTVDFCVRGNPIYNKVHDIVTSGQLGHIKRVTWMVTDWYRPQTYHDSATWRSSWATEGGGTLINQNPHQLDLWQWMFGMPEKLMADVSFGKYYDIEVDDDVTCIMKYADGMTGVYETSTGETPGTNRLDISADMGRLVVEDGKIIFTKNEMSEREWNAAGNSEEPEHTVEEIKPDSTEDLMHAGITNNFVEAILDGSDLLVSGFDGINELTLSNAMYLSAWKNNEWIDIKNFPKDEFYSLLKERIASSKKRERKFAGAAAYNNLEATQKKK